MAEFKGKYKNAKVFFRIFPTEKSNWDHVKICRDRKTIFCRCLQDLQAGHEDCIPKYWNFKSDGVFCNKLQSDIYETVMDGVIDGVLRGNNAIIVSYGQTGTGKTLTATGLYNAPQDLGIAPRAISDLFLKIKEERKPNIKISIEMSYIEARNAYFVDLLGSEICCLDQNSLKLITLAKIRNEDEALKNMYKGEGRRDLTSNSPYESHKANGVVTFHIVKEYTNYAKPLKTISKLHIVDLAGADTCGNLTCFYKNATEVGTGNLAKSQIEQFLLILCENIPQHIKVKQRMNVLLRYVNESLSTNSILRFVGHIRTTKENLTITLSMLRFGQIIKGLPSQELTVKEVEDKEARAVILEDEIKTIKNQKILESMLANNDLSTNITQERVKHMQNTAEEYLKNKTNEIVIANVTDINTVLKVFKNLYNDLEAARTEDQKNIYKQAYADALANFEAAANSSNSLISMKESKIGRKGSKRLSSKSVQPRISKSTSKISVSLQSDDKRSSLTKYTDRPGSETSRKLSGGKRRSSGSLALGSFKGSISEEKKDKSIIPEELPSREIAWSLFINNNGYDYNRLEENVKASKSCCKVANDSYLAQVDNLQGLVEIVEKRQMEVLQARMQKIYKQGIAMDTTSDVKTELEELCEGNLKVAEQELVKQQDIVLKHQTEFKIALETYNRDVKFLNEEFDQFCREKFGTLLPELNNISPVTEKEAGPSPTETQVAKEKTVEEDTANYKSLMQHNTFKEIMLSERRKVLRDKERSKKWV